MEAIVLAGGLGTRLRAAVPDLPKPMAPVDGKPFLTYLLDYWVEQGIERFVLSVGYKSSVVQDHYGESYRGVPIGYSIERELLGTGGGAILATRQLSAEEPFILLNGDTFFPVDLVGMRAFHNEVGAALTIALTDIGENDRYSGVEIGEKGRLVSFSAERGGASCLINAGCYLIDPSTLGRYGWDGEKTSLEDVILPALIGQGVEIYGQVSEAPFIDIGIPGDYHRCGEVMRSYLASATNTGERV